MSCLRFSFLTVIVWVGEFSGGLYAWFIGCFAALVIALSLRCYAVLDCLLSFWIVGWVLFLLLLLGCWLVVFACLSG